MDDQLWQRLGVTAGGLEKLRLYASLTEKWTARINLIAKSTVSQIWERHIEDSARIALFSPEKPRIWADFGSGGGFPGIVMATILADRGAETRMILVESDQRKATFLREAARLLGLSVEVRAERAEALPPLGADVVSARALAALDALCAILQRHGAAEATGIFPKGERWEQEVDDARKNWLFELDAEPDPGHNGAAILLVRNLRCASRDART